MRHARNSDYSLWPDIIGTAGQDAMATESYGNFGLGTGRRWSQFWSHSLRFESVRGGTGPGRSCRSQTALTQHERSPVTDLESVLGATPREFESRILRSSDQARRQTASSVLRPEFWPSLIPLVSFGPAARSYEASSASHSSPPTCLATSRRMVPACQVRLPTVIRFRACRRIRPSPGISPGHPADPPEASASLGRGMRIERDLRYQEGHYRHGTASGQLVMRIAAGMLRCIHSATIRRAVNARKRGASSCERNSRIIHGITTLFCTITR
jgi:hypothetical protein